MVSSFVFEVISFARKRRRTVLAGKRHAIALLGVRHPMFFERVLACKPLRALSARKRLLTAIAIAHAVARLLRVQKLDMFPERGGIRKALCAVRANLTALRRVNAFVHRAIMARRKGAHTKRALVPSAVHFAVFVQIWQPRKGQMTARKVAAKRAWPFPASRFRLCLGLCARCRRRSRSIALSVSRGDVVLDEAVPIGEDGEALPTRND